MRSELKEWIRQPAITSNTFSLMDAFSVNPAGLLLQPSDCKQSTLPQISSSPAVCLSIAHCLLSCNLKSQLPAPASSPLFGGSAECFNCPRADGWLHYTMQSAANNPKSCQWQVFFTINMLVDKKKKKKKWVNYELQSVIIINQTTT